LYPAAVHADGAFVGPPGLFGAGTTTLPAAPGGRILLYATGMGDTNPPTDPAILLTGARPLATPNDLRILIDDVAATIEFAGMISNGLVQINIVVPDAPDGDRTIVAEIGGMRSQSTLRLRVTRPPPLPQITSMDPNDFVWGQAAAVFLTGTNLRGATRVEFSDQQGLTVTGVTASETTVNFRLTVAGGAVEGERTLTLVSPNGRSNSSAFTIRRGMLNITQFQPSVVYPDRVYASSDVYSSTRAQFRVTGTDLAGVNNVTFTPPTGFGLFGVSTTTGLFGNLVVSSNAPPGTVEFSASSPGGSSNTVSFEVAAPPANAPVISDVTLQAPTISGNVITYRGSITFTDSDGDIRAGTGGAFLRFTLGDFNIRATFDATGAFLGVSGQTSGTINFTYDQSVRLFILRLNTTTQVAVTLVDAANNPSNTVIVSVPSWISPVF
jgi:hypothetical protein